MDIQEYRKQFIDELRFYAGHEGTDPETQFIAKTISELEEIGELMDPTIQQVHLRMGNSNAGFDAYAYDEADGSFIMICSDYSNCRESASTLTNTRIDDLYKKMARFVEATNDGKISKYSDESDPVRVVADEFRKRLGKSLQSSEILRFKFYIISDSTLSKTVKNITKPDLLGRPAELSVWTIERFFQTFASNSSEIIEIDTEDFGCDGIQCLKADLGESSQYDAYLGIVPGEFLAQIYLKYGSKLLQGNVRSFLSFRGTVNKGIRETIINKPENFFTFNNGIAVVARSVEFSSDGKSIIHLKDPQIINGGQTTASLASVLIKKEARKGMDTLFVPMKLTVLNVENDMSEEQIEAYNSITQKISQCANCQNPVSGADFFSNHPFHVMMETLSKKVMAPPVNGNPYQTMWFYERSRGNWEVEQLKMTASQKKKFCEMYPKHQVIKKEKLAKCYNSILMNPNQVCQSSAINFKYFASYIENLYDSQRDSINDEFFKKCVCSVILFDTLDTFVGKEEWYPKGGNKAQIVPYTISKLMTLLPDKKDIDWHQIWMKQTLSTVMVEQLLDLAYHTHSFLEKQANGGIVRTISRTQATWAKFKEYEYSLSDKFLTSLVSMDVGKDAARIAKKECRFNSNVDSSLKIFNLGADYWMGVYKELSESRIVSSGDCDFIKSISGYISRNSLLTPAQCKRLLKIVSDAEDKGYTMPI